MEINNKNDKYTVLSEEKNKSIWESLTEKDITVFDELGNIPIKKIHTEAYISIICLEGRGSATIEGKEYEFKKHDIVFGHPNQFIENVMVSCDFKCLGMLLSPTYFQSIFNLSGNFWEAGLSVRKFPVISLSEQEVEGFLVTHQMLKHKLTLTNLPHHKQSFKLLLQSLIYEFYDILAPKLQLNGELYSYSSSSSEVLFKRFISLVSTESPRRHEVSFYADKLCITPKYLSSICKKQTGKTTSEIVNYVTLSYIKQMLLSSDKTIKEIATETGFDNLSFFGKYVKRELGMSPREYRQKGERQ